LRPVRVMVNAVSAVAFSVRVSATVMLVAVSPVIRKLRPLLPGVM
jgi:hypothetical protein